MKSSLVATQIKKILLDVLKPHEPQIQELASKLGALPGISEVSISLAEIDQSTESIKVSIDGTNISIDSVRKTLEELGAVIHSIDQVSVAKKTSRSRQA
jgi:hypothetical protein